MSDRPAELPRQPTGNDSLPLSAPAGSSPSHWRAILETLLIFVVFSLHGAWPVPDVNEPYYLSKAKHYWDPAWCKPDLFLRTPDAHETFYVGFGWVTRYFSLDATAWVGRLLTWALLAWAWRRLSWAVVPVNWLAVLSAALFITLNENAHMADEWVVGGVEAKGFAYVLVLLGFERVVPRAMELGVAATRRGVARSRDCRRLGDRGGGSGVAHGPGPTTSRPDPKWRQASSAGCCWHCPACILAGS